MNDSRGFDAFVGKTVKAIDADAINVVKITFDDESSYEILAEDRHHNIEVISAFIAE